MQATKSWSRSPTSHARSGLVGESDMMMPSFPFARDSIRRPEFRQRRSGTRSRLTLVAHTFLLKALRSMSISRKPPRLSSRRICCVPTAPTLMLRKNSRLLLNPTVTTSTESAIRHQVGHGGPERAGEFFDRGDGDVPLAPLDTADIGPVQPREVGQGFLGNPCVVAEL